MSDENYPKYLNQIGGGLNMFTVGEDGDEIIAAPAVGIIWDGFTVDFNQDTGHIHVTSGGGGAGVESFAGRTGIVLPATGDYTVSQVTGAAPLASPTLTGTPLAPTATAGTNTTQIATTAFVTAAVASVVGAVSSVFTRTGAVTAQTGDYSVGQVTGAAPLASPTFTGTPLAPTATVGTNTTQVATTAFVTAAIAAIPAAPVSSVFARTGAVVAANGDYTVSQVTGAAPLASPALTGTPTAPTAAALTNTTQLATTAFVTAAIAALPSAPVTSVFTRTGAVAAQAGDYAVGQVTGAAPLASPTFTGTPLAPTATAGTNTTQVATTAFVTTAVAASVVTFNGRSGTVVPTTGDYAVANVTGAAPLASPTFTGTPLAPTATAGTNTTQIATTAFVTAAVSGISGFVPTTGGSIMTGDLGPTTDVTRSLGTASLRFLNLFVGNVGSATVRANVFSTQVSAGTSTLVLTSTGVSSDIILSPNSVNTIQVTNNAPGRALIPTTDNSTSLGVSALRFKTLFLTGVDSLSIDNATQAAGAVIGLINTLPTGRTGVATWVRILVDGVDAVIPAFK